MFGQTQRPFIAPLLEQISKQIISLSIKYFELNLLDNIFNFTLVSYYRHFEILFIAFFFY